LVRAARPGVARYVNHGSAFGWHQLSIENSDGTEDFYAHMTGRLVSNGARVKAGQVVGRVGAEGNVTGPHLHFERHACHGCQWNCSIVRDPMPSVNWQPKPTDPNNEEFTVGYRQWDQKDKDALTTDVAKAVLGAQMNIMPGAKGEDQFEGKSVRDVLKGLYRKAFPIKK
jgi:hypothetical protein